MELEEGGEPWSPQSRVVTRAPAAIRPCVAETRPRPPLTISPLPWSSSERSALYTARFESRLVFGVEQTGATLRAPPIFQFFASLAVIKSVIL